MSTIKNKAIIYAVVREAFMSGNPVICCFTKTYDGAIRLADEYAQEFVDKFGVDTGISFNVHGNVFYDE